MYFDINSFLCYLGVLRIAQLYIQYIVLGIWPKLLNDGTKSVTKCTTIIFYYKKKIKKEMKESKLAYILLNFSGKVY